MSEDFWENYPALTGMTREEILEKMQRTMKPKRFEHCLRVEKKSRQLAERYGANPDKAALAGLLHDYAKNLSDEEFLQLIEKYRLDPELKNWNNSVWHGKVGIYKIQEDFHLQDAEILQAIEAHTVGNAAMTTLDKVVYVADYIEDGRDFPGVEKARELAEKSLDAAVAFETARTVEYLAAKFLPIYPQTLETYNAYISQLTADKDAPSGYKIWK